MGTGVFGSYEKVSDETVAGADADKVPSPTAIERSERIVELFRKNPDSGAIAMDGEMIDRPHWLKARRILKIAERNK